MASAVDILLQSTLDNVRATNRNISEFFSDRQNRERQLEDEARRRRQSLSDEERRREQALEDEARRRSLALEDDKRLYDRRRRDLLADEERKRKLEKEDAEELRRINALASKEDRIREMLGLPGMEGFSIKSPESEVRAAYIKAKETIRENLAKEKLDADIAKEERAFQTVVKTGDHRMKQVLRERIALSGQPGVMDTLGPEASVDQMLGVLAVINGAEKDDKISRDREYGKTLASMGKALEDKMAKLTQQEQAQIQQMMSAEFERQVNLLPNLSAEAKRTILNNRDNPEAAVAGLNDPDSALAAIQTARVNASTAMAEMDLSGSSPGLRLLQEEFRAFQQLKQRAPQEAIMSYQGALSEANSLESPDLEDDSGDSEGAFSPPSLDALNEAIPHGGVAPAPTSGAAPQAPAPVEAPVPAAFGPSSFPVEAPSHIPHVPEAYGESPLFTQNNLVQAGPFGPQVAASPGVRQAPPENIQAWQASAKEFLEPLRDTIGSSSVSTVGGQFGGGFVNNVLGIARSPYGVTHTRTDPQTGRQDDFLDPAKVLGIASSILRNPNSSPEQMQAAEVIRQKYAALFGAGQSAPVLSSQRPVPAHLASPFIQ